AWQRLSAILGFALTVGSALPALGYLYGAPELYTVSGRFSAVAANTAIALMLLGIGIQFANLSASPLHRLASGYRGGLMLPPARPVAIVLRIATVGTRLIAQTRGLFDSNAFGGAAVAGVMVMSFAYALIWYAGMLDRLDRAQRRGDEQIKRL